MLRLCELFYDARAGYGSESEADEESATVSLASDVGRVNRTSSRNAVRLQEIGPRMTLRLVKVEEGLCSGGTIFTEFGEFAYSPKIHLPWFLVNRCYLKLVMLSVFAWS